MTARHKKHYKRSRTSKVKGKGKRGGDNRYFTEVGDPDRDSVDEKAEKTFTNLGIPNTEIFDTQNGWLAVGIVGVIGVILLGVTVIKRR